MVKNHKNKPKGTDKEKENGSERAGNDKREHIRGGKKGN